MNWIDVLKEWQSLAGGLLAIAGGAFVVLQTAEMRRQEANRMKRRHAAARAVMPLALSALCEYAKVCAKTLYQIQRHADEGGIPTSSHYPDFPSLPVDIVSRFADVIESSNARTADSFAQILRDVQVHSSRLRSLTSDLASSSSGVTTHNIDHNIVDSIELYARAETLFDYARGKTKQVPREPLDVTRVFNALEIAGVHNRSDDLFAVIRARAEKRQSDLSGRSASERIREWTTKRVATALSIVGRQKGPRPARSSG